MRRFFVESQGIQDGRVTICGGDARHIAKVLRLGAGSIIRVVDSAGRELEVALTTVADTCVTGAVVAVRERSSALPSVELTLVQGLPKGDKMDLVVQKCTELGVSRFMPVLTARSVARPDSGAASRRVQRWRRIAAEAAKQCGVGRAPEVRDILTLGEALGLLSEEKPFMLFPWECETESGLRKALRQVALSGVRRITVFIGPEGGFEREEAKSVIEAGAIPVSLGRRILRTETAGMVVAAVIMYELGELG
ncbi:MAG: RsmE family RNA methyltransferase [Bacillota bacterium]